MVKTNFPVDFFEGKFFEKKGKKPRFLNRYLAQRFLPYVRIPVEHTIILGIVILVLLVISYAVGVERGKQISSVKTTRVAQDAARAPRPGPEGAAQPEAGGTAEVPQVSQNAEVEYPYLIQLVSFKKEKYAEREVEKLKKAGKDAFFVKTGEWYPVSVKGYRTIGETREAKNVFNKEYPDCFIRRKR